MIATTTGENVRGLVYIAALAPDEGETVAEVFYREQPHPQAPHLQPDAHGLIWMPPEGFQNAFAQNASDDVSRLLPPCNGRLRSVAFRRQRLNPQGGLNLPGSSSRKKTA